MRVIKFKKPYDKVINPAFVESIKLVKGEYDEKWCVSLELQSGKIYTTEPTTEELALQTYEYVISCMESVN